MRHARLVWEGEIIQRYMTSGIVPRHRRCKKRRPAAGATIFR